MPSKPKAASKPRRVIGKKIAGKSRSTAGKIKGQRIEQTGLNSRILGHVSARGKRSQARRDAR